MTRKQLEHVIRASGAIAEVDRLVIIGSQALLGSHPEAPEDLLTSMEADVYPPDKAERADLIDGSIGEDSFFHETFGYYAHGIGPETKIQIILKVSARHPKILPSQNCLRKEKRTLNLLKG